MRLYDIYQKAIDREITGVIKVDKMIIKMYYKN